MTMTTDNLHPDELLVRRAYEFAAAAHGRINQLRKYTDEPYIHHPVEVALLVSLTGAPAEAVAAAFLHDVVEDTPVTNDDIRREFGDVVADLVAEVTDVSRPEDGNRKARKEKDRAHIAKASPHGKTIKLADLISNSASIVKHDKNFARVYLREKEALLQVLEEGDASLLEEAKSILVSGAASLGNHW